MNEIQLLYVENIISRKKRQMQQTVYFFMRVENLGYDKQCEVLWAGEDGVWQTLPATFHSILDDKSEYWQAQLTVNANPETSLPGNIQFALHFQALGNDYWDNQQGQNYSSQADSGINMVVDQPLMVIGHADQIHADQQHMAIKVSVNQLVHAETVTIHWTTDNWRHTHKTPCHTQRHYWDEQSRSNARNPNQYGCQIWQGVLNVEAVYRLQYYLSCECPDQVLWDNNYGRHYVAARRPLNVMILNLHCYQEANQDAKFSQIAKAINELEVDIVCFQEVAEFWNNGHGDWDSNSAKIINDRLNHPFHLYTDWSHLGFDQYREGVAILSRYPLANQSAKYVSHSHSAHSIHSRKVVMAQVDVPCIGLINVFSAHLSWWEDGFADQFKRLGQWAQSCQSEAVGTTLLCGDFNVTAGSEGYNLVVDGNEYDDQFLAANDKRLFEKIFRVNDAHWQHHLADDYRIDYIFMNKASPLRITSAKVLFTDDDYGRVSDHCGYLMSFEPKPVD
ncbi:MAG: endonuclease/exonuclease/phosphatase family protein [Methylococcales bacterium]|nr:endonuclease/exonuclease/phosphatase family protein [Methylococcales bacterium]